MTVFCEGREPRTGTGGVKALSLLPFPNFRLARCSMLGKKEKDRHCLFVFYPTQAKNSDLSPECQEKFVTVYVFVIFACLFLFWKNILSLKELPLSPSIARISSHLYFTFPVVVGSNKAWSNPALFVKNKYTTMQLLDKVTISPNKYLSSICHGQKLIIDLCKILRTFTSDSNRPVRLEKKTD